MKHEISVTIKPTHFCNMSCKHCFNGEKLHDKSFLPAASACRFLELIAVDYDDIGLTFHGGEPTLAGIDFYREVFSCKKRLSDDLGTVFSVNFTTNGLNLNDALAELLINNNVLINISFDGPHNGVLREHTDFIYDRLCSLKRQGARLRVYCVETAQSVSSLIHTYEWFRGQKLNFKMVPVQPYGNAKDKYDLIMDIPYFVEELMSLYRYWLTDKTCEITFFTLEEFLQIEPNSAFKQPWLYRKLALNPDGKIYPFGRPNDVNFCLGDTKTLDKINDCFESNEYKRLILIIEKYIDKFCKDCKSASTCAGITISSSFVYGSDIDVIKYGCCLADRIFRSVLDINKEVMQDIENGNSEKYAFKVQKRFGGINTIA